MTKAKPYQIVGLVLADSMPIKFAGRDFDLADLSAEELAFLLQYPEQVPYLRLTKTAVVTGSDQADA
ncbi:hypothetical protein DYU11_21070 [Fibrisoma montanum]|uniref:Uncharacterized protein n=1 Tax=Fibrisoma montanum TaxID=2305895 RepID=A0A418M499_9BACT|nr:hypothetical protein [Fibrisoma montanum]RIV20539.1 hypothetical protein DYU11_21070 [Fibrisoma montanum]